MAKSLWPSLWPHFKGLKGLLISDKQTSLSKKRGATVAKTKRVAKENIISEDKGVSYWRLIKNVRWCCCDSGQNITPKNLNIWIKTFKVLWVCCHRPTLNLEHQSVNAFRITLPTYDQSYRLIVLVKCNIWVRGCGGTPKRNLMEGLNSLVCGCWRFDIQSQHICL